MAFNNYSSSNISSVSAPSAGSISWNSSDSSVPDQSSNGAAAARLQSTASSGAARAGNQTDLVDAEELGSSAHANSLAASWGQFPEGQEQSNTNTSTSAGGDDTENPDSTPGSPTDPNSKMRELCQTAEGEVRNGGQPGSGYDQLEQTYKSSDKQSLSQPMVTRVEGALMLGKLHRDSNQREQARAEARDWLQSVGGGGS